MQFLPRFRALSGVLTASWLAAACVQPPATGPTPAPPLVFDKTVEAVAGSARYDIVRAESEIRIFVLRGGPLARFGHNHVIGGAVVSGEILLADDLRDSGYTLEIHLADLEVDRAQWRLEAGSAYESMPSDEDIAATRENMLGERVLDVARFPRARVESAGILGELPDFSVLARITLKDHTRSLPVPVHFDRLGQRIVLKGSLALTQSDFGIEPFSVLLGAISVQDELRIDYRIVGQPAP